MKFHWLKEVACCRVVKFFRFIGGAMAVVKVVAVAGGEVSVPKSMAELRGERRRHYHRREGQRRRMDSVAADQLRRGVVAPGAVRDERAGVEVVDEVGGGGGGARVVCHRLLDDDVVDALRRLGLDPLERGEHGHEVGEPRAAHVGVVPDARHARRLVERVPPARRRAERVLQALLHAVELAHDRLLLLRRRPRGVGGGAAEEEAVGDGGDGGVAEAVRPPGGGEEDDGDARAAEHGQLAGLLEDSLAALGEAHLPRLLVLDQLHLDPLPPPRPLPPPPLAAADVHLRRRLRHRRRRARTCHVQRVGFI